MSSGGIHGLLLKLHELLSEEDSRAAALVCHDLVGDLGQECMLASTDNDLGKSTKISHLYSIFKNQSKELQTPFTVW